MMEPTKHLSAIVDYRISFFALEPVLKSLAERGCKLDIYSSDALVEGVKRALPVNQITIFSLDEVRRKTLWWYRFHRVMRIMIADPNFSTSSWYQHDRERNGASRRMRMLYRVAERAPKVRGNRVNRVLNATVGGLVPNIFRTQKVISQSRTLVPELLCARGLKIQTIVESWDHPGKYPAGFVTDNAFTWNRTLGEDWLFYQGDHRFTVSYPMKHRYVVEHAQSTGGNAGIRGTGGKYHVIMYAPAWTGQSSNKAIFKEELDQIEELCEVTKRHNMRLFIKPKPQGNTRDFDFLAAKHSHVSVGSYKQSGTRPEDYYLDSEYNKTRIEELKCCDLMINGGTTFGIDAAIFGLPVLQLDFSQSTRYPVTAKAFRSYHLQKYFLMDPSITLKIGKDDSLFEKVDSYLKAPDRREIKFSKRLREWIWTDESFESAMDRVAENILLR